ncbi:MAG TPA: ATP-binding protein [Bacilli bacterium]|nr:ATP-binding protein [Bacilli bacterium]
MSRAEVKLHIEEQVEAIVVNILLQEGFETNSNLADILRDYTAWLFDQILTDAPVSLHEEFCALGDWIADHGYSVDQVMRVINGLRKMIQGLLKRLLEEEEQSVDTLFHTLGLSMEFLTVNSTELLERYVQFRERKVAETHLQNLETVLDTIPNSIMTYDDNGLLTYANKTACELMEVGKEELIGHHHDSFLPLPGYSKSGRKIWVTQELIPLDNGAGSVLIGYPIVRELEYYRILQAQTEFIFNSMTEGLVIIDKDNIVTTFNSRAEKLFGIPRGEIINKSGSLFLEKLQLDEGLSLLHTTMRTGSTFTDIQQTVRSCDGVERILKTSTRTILGERDEILGSIGIFEDLTDRLFLEEQVRRAEKFSVLGKFAAGIAHEIRNPLTTAKGFLQLLPNDSPDPKIRQLKALVIPEIDRANEIITDFLMIAKPSAPQLKIGSLGAVIEDLVGLIGPQAIIQNIELIYTPYEDLKPVAIDRAQLLQVFLNLCNNAFDAMKDGGQLRIDVQDCASHVAIHFRDTGIGMEKDVIERIFEPFYTKKGNGTGLGLSVSHRIIEGHYGTIYVNSSVGGGSTFTIQLPFVD